MIGKLKGLVDTIEKDYLIIDVNGVGYIVFCSARTLSKIPTTGLATSLIIETHVREDHINLYGFMDIVERDWFRQLLTVKAVGSKLALAILGTLTPEQITTALAAKDKAAFTQISGVGPKLADRILTELKDKTVMSGNFEVTNYGDDKAFSGSNGSILNDAISALVNLGYSRSESYNLTNKIYSQHPDISIGELIRLALKELTR